jgi:hypothetical protein
MPWRSTDQISFNYDSTNKSFVFSLTNGDKFISTTESSIINHREKGPIFGKFDLAISDKSN